MSVIVNRVRRGFYADSVALMRISRGVAALSGIEEASMMIGTPANRDLLAGSGLLVAEGEKAQEYLCGLHKRYVHRAERIESRIAKQPKIPCPWLFDRPV